VDKTPKIKNGIFFSHFMFYYFSLLKAKKKLKSLEEEIEGEVKKVNPNLSHSTTLISIGLIAPVALYYTLPQEERKRLENNFEDYIHMMAYGLFSGDLEDRLNDESEDEDLRKSIEKLRVDFSKKAKKIAKKYGILDMFNNAESISRKFQEKELVYSKKLKDGDYSFILELFKEDDTLGNLTYGRVGILFEFGVDAAYEIFLKGTKYKDLRDTLRKWAVYLAAALQEGYDDINDFEDDLENYKPTPIVLRSFYLKAIRGSNSKELSENEINYGIISTTSQVEFYLIQVEDMKLPKVLKIITKSAASKIRRGIYE